MNIEKFRTRKIIFVVIIAVCILTLANVLYGQAQFNQMLTTFAFTEPHISNEIVVSDIDNDTYNPSVAYNWKHHEYLVVWHTKWTLGTRDIRAALVSRSGQVINEFTVFEHVTRESGQPSVAYDPVHDRFLVVWVYDTFGNGSDWDLYGRFVPWDGPDASLSAFPISTFGTHQWNPKIVYARAMEEYLVVWSNEYQSGLLPMYISGQRINAADGSFSGNLTISHLTQQRVNPDLTYNLARNEYLIVYDDTKDILGMRFTGDLGHSFSGEFSIAGWPDAEIHAAVAACSEVDQYLVTWQSDQGSSNDAIYARFISGNGTVGNVYTIDDTTSLEREADVSCNKNGNSYLIAWQTEYINSRYGIWGRLVLPNASMSPSFLIVDPGATSDRTDPVIAGGHSDYLVAWEHSRNGAAYLDIHARLVTPFMINLPLVNR